MYKAPEEWGADKSTLPMDFPNLPYIFDGNHSQSETIAIMEYLASKYCPAMMGKTAEEKGKLAQLRNIITEASNETRMLFYTSGDKAAIVKKAEEKYEKIHKYLEGKTYLLGDNISYLDLYLFEDEELLDSLTEGTFMDKFPNFYAHMSSVRQLPQIVAYRKEGTGKFNKHLTFLGPRAKLDVKPRAY